MSVTMEAEQGAQTTRAGGEPGVSEWWWDGVLIREEAVRERGRRAEKKLEKKAEDWHASRP